MRILWCWRCRAELPMLDDDEWAVVRQAHALSRSDPAQADALLESERIRRGLPPIPPLPDTADLAARTFRHLVNGYALFTGVAEDVPNAVWHHVASLYGPPCEHCGKPLRTPQARWCPACGGWRGAHRIVG
jgi:hypothetical protein